MWASLVRIATRKGLGSYLPGNVSLLKHCETICVCSISVMTSSIVVSSFWAMSRFCERATLPWHLLRFLTILSTPWHGFVFLQVSKPTCELMSFSSNATLFVELDLSSSGRTFSAVAATFRTHVSSASPSLIESRRWHWFSTMFTCVRTLCYSKFVSSPRKSVMDPLDVLHWLSSCDAVSGFVSSRQKYNGSIRLIRDV